MRRFICFIAVLLVCLLALQPAAVSAAPSYTATGTPVITKITTTPLAATTAAVRLRNFSSRFNRSGVFLGVPDLSNFWSRVISPLGTPVWSLTGPNHITFSYNPDTGRIYTTVTIGGTQVTSMNYPTGDLGTLNYIKIDIFARRANTTVELNNVTIDGISLGSFNPTAWESEWTTLSANSFEVGGLDLTTGFTLEADLSITGTDIPAPEDNMVEIGVGFYDNQPPTSTNQSFSTQEDTSLIGTLSASDNEDDMLTFAAVTGPSHGTLSSITSTGVFTYTPDTDYNGSDSFTFTVDDIYSAPVGPFTASIDVTPVNDEPESDNQSFTTQEDTVLSDVLAAEDEENDTLTFAVVEGPDHGMLSTIGSDGSFTFTPDENWNGTDTFTFTVTDSHSPAVSPFTVTIDVTATNDIPQSIDQSFTTAEDTDLVDVLAASDVDGDTLTFAVSTPPIYGTLSTIGSDGAFTYTPADNYNGPDTFSFAVTDSHSSPVGPFTVSIEVTPANDAPESDDQSFTTQEDAALVDALVAPDIDGDTLTFAVVASPSNGTLSEIGSDGSFTYTPDENWNGSDSFTFTVTDSHIPTPIGPFTASIDVTPVNDEPESDNQSFTTQEDTALSDVLAADDEENDTLTFAVVEAPDHGTLSTIGSDGSFTYTPDANYNGPDTFSFTVTDSHSSPVGPFTVSIDVDEVNDAPEFDLSGDVTDAEDFLLDRTVTVTPDPVPSDEAGHVVTYSLSPASVAFATVGIDTSTGEVTISAVADGFGTQVFTITADDGQSENNTAQQTFTLTVTPVNDSPESEDQEFSMGEDDTLSTSLTATDVDDVSLTFALSGDAPAGDFQLDPDGSFTFTPELNFFGDVSFDFTVTDTHIPTPIGPFTATIHITEGGIMPELSPIIDWVVKSGTTISFTAGLSNPLGTGDVAVYELVDPPTGAAIDPSTGAFSWTPLWSNTHDNEYTITVQVTVNGNASRTDTETFSVTVNPYKYYFALIGR